MEWWSSNGHIYDKPFLIASYFFIKLLLIRIINDLFVIVVDWKGKHKNYSNVNLLQRNGWKI